MAGITLTQEQFDALVSFDFNTGDLANSSIPRRMRSRDLSGACATLAMYNHADGKVLNGLTRRRSCEVALMQGNIPLACKFAQIDPPPTSTQGA
jgi:lysozyme